MRKSICTVVMLGMLAGSAFAQGSNTSTTRYRWRDAQGQPHFSDSLSAEALKYGYDVVNDHGLVVQKVPRQLSPEEAEAARQQAAKQAEQQHQAEQAARLDAQMLAAYPDEASYRAAQQMSLDSIDQQIGTIRSNLGAQEKALADLLGRAGDLERAKQPVPKLLTDKIAAQRDVVARQRDNLLRQQALRADSAGKASAQLEHYRALKATQAAGGQ